MLADAMPAKGVSGSGSEYEVNPLKYLLESYCGNQSWRPGSEGGAFDGYIGTGYGTGLTKLAGRNDEGARAARVTRTVSTSNASGFDGPCVL